MQGRSYIVGVLLEDVLAAGDARLASDLAANLLESVHG